MSRRKSELMAVDRSHTAKLEGLPNNSNLGSFAAHKHMVVDNTHASHNPLDMMTANPNRKASKARNKEDQFDLDLTAIKRQQTQAKGRKSIFIPKKAVHGDMLDMSNRSPKVADSDNDEDRSDVTDTEQKKRSERYSLKTYNKDRKQKLFDFEYSRADDEEEPPESLDSKVMLANKLQLNCFGNLEVSLFWEEKFVVLIRIAQLYTLLFFFYYEQWPSNTRKYLTIMFTGFTGSSFIQDQDEFYQFMQNLKLIQYVVAAAFLANLLLTIIGLVLTCKKTLRYRLEFMYTSGCNVYRLYFWWMEIVFVPLLFNMSYPATCKFWSERDAITFVDCHEDGQIYYWVLKGLMCGGYLMAGLYNIQLFSYIFRNKISTEFHEHAVQKKEVEYSYGINRIWSTEKFFTFSSFKSGVGSIYHRIIFNLFAMLFIGIHAIQKKADLDDMKLTISFHTLIVFVFTIHVIMTRPYRSFSTNLLYILCLIAFMTMTIMMYMKVQGYKQSVFIDKYFFLLTIFLSGFLWFLVVCWILFILITRHKWILDKETVMELTEGQDLAIYYIKDARQFIVTLLAKKKYTEKDSIRMEQLIENLTMQFNNFRGTQPLIMDSLLETIDSLRLLQRNYEQDPELFNFDYREDLMLMARERERVFSLSKFSTQAGEDDEEETSANIFSRIYGYGGNSGGRAFGSNVDLDDDDNEDTAYAAKPERTNYDDYTGNATKFNQFNRSQPKANPDEIEMQFSNM